MRLAAVAVSLQAGGAKENVSVLVIRLNTDRGPSLARLRPTRQVMSIDDYEAAMAHDAALKAQRAARAATLASLTSAAQPGAPASGHVLSQTGSSSSGLTARMSFTSSGASNNDDDATPRNSSEPLSVNTSPLSPDPTGSSSSSSTVSGGTLRVNFTGADDDDELLKQLIRSQQSNDGDDDDVDVDDRFVRDIIRAEPPPLPTSSGAAGQRQQRRRQRPSADDRDLAALHHAPRFVKKSSPAAQPTELGGPMSLRRSNGPDAAEPRLASSLPRRLTVEVENDNAPTSPFAGADVTRSPVNFGRRFPPPSMQQRSPALNSAAAKPAMTSAIASTRHSDALPRQNGDTQFFVEVARF